MKSAHDTEGQSLETRTQDCVDVPNTHKRVQTRLVFETIGVPLSEHDNSWSLIIIFNQVLIGERGMSETSKGLCSVSA